MRTLGWRAWVVAGLMTSCGGKNAAADVSNVDWACATATEGELRDAADVRATAPEIEVGRVPLRVNIRPEGPGYLALTIEEDADLLVLADDQPAIAALWQGIERTELFALASEPRCESTPLFEVELQLEAGSYALEVGPTTQANVWIALVAE